VFLAVTLVLQGSHRFAERRQDAIPKLKRLCFVCGLEDVIWLAEKIQRYKPATNTEAMEAAMDDFLERWS
jgi:hypothetical protein